MAVPPLEQSKWWLSSKYRRIARRTDMAQWRATTESRWSGRIRRDSCMYGESGVRGASRRWAAVGCGLWHVLVWFELLEGADWEPWHVSLFDITPFTCKSCSFQNINIFIILYECLKPRLHCLVGWCERTGWAHDVRRLEKSKLEKFVWRNKSLYKESKQREHKKKSEMLVIRTS